MPYNNEQRLTPEEIKQGKTQIDKYFEKVTPALLRLAQDSIL
nr:hypothetical protein [Mycoplasmopsis bovis]